MLSLLLALVLVAQDETRPQDLDTGFHYNLSHRHHLEVDSVTSAYGGLTDVLHLAMDDEMRENRFCKLAKYGFSAWLDTIVMNTAHEYGHISALSRVGFNVRTTLLVDEEKFGATNPASVTWGAILGRTSLALNEEDWAKVHEKLGFGKKYNDYYTLVLAGGLNQEQLFVNRNVDRYLNNELSRLDSWVIFWGNLSTIRYGADGDKFYYIQQVGHTSQNAVDNYSLVRLLSGSNLRGFLAFLEGAAGVHGGFIKPLGFELNQSGSNVIFCPEFQSYLTLKGPSVKAELPARLCGVLFMPSVEAAHGAEGGLRVVAPITSFLKVESEIYHNSDGNWFGGSAELRPWQWLGIYAGYNYAHGHTLHHDVYGATMDNTERSVIAGLNAHFVF